jgi:acetyl-CoA C-acetyltransferase
VWANGGYATKHSIGIYSTEPPSRGFRRDHPQDEIDALPRKELASLGAAAGPVTVEAYSVMHSRDGVPETAYAACLTDGGQRAWGASSDPGVAEAMCDGEWVGRRVTLTPDGTLLVA